MANLGDSEFESLVVEEVTVLQSIYEDQLEIRRDSKGSITSLSILLYPATADDISSQFVKLLLELSIPPQYPEVPLKINIKMSRGLSDELLRNLKFKLNKHVEDSIGTSVLFDLIEMAKDSLTSHNMPSSPCPICLNLFQEFHDFVKTECFHFLHSYCLFEYVSYEIKQVNQAINSDRRPKSRKKPPKEEMTHVPCPVCREPITFDLEAISCAKQPIDTEPLLLDLSKIKREVQEMEKIFNYQKQIGGIIDLEAEKKKHLLSSIEQAYARSSIITLSESNSNIQDSASGSLTEESPTKLSEEQPQPKHVDKRTYHRRPERHRIKNNPGDSKHVDGKSPGGKVNFHGEAKNRFPFQNRRSPSETQNRPHKQSYYNSTFNRVNRGRGKPQPNKYDSQKRQETTEVYGNTSRHFQRDRKPNYKSDGISEANERKHSNNKPPPGLS